LTDLSPGASVPVCTSAVIPPAVYLAHPKVFCEARH
jgi:hypothetical protein